ncbi:MAG: RimK family alpha-L-glutamate ligase [Bdellovibrionales bacterium]
MTEASSEKIYILYENEDWLTPLAMALDAIGVNYEGMKVIEGGVALDQEPPQGVFFNRLSASSHTRGHTGSVALGGAILAWLEHHGRRVVNGRHVIDLEVRKFDQYALLQAAGIAVPETIATTGQKALIEAAEKLSSKSGGPFIVKPNRGGKGLGVRLFDSVQALKEAMGQGDDDFVSIDGIQLVQEYIEGKEKRILRNEFIGGQYYYSVEVNTEAGFELCPADSCCIADAKPDGDKFRILHGYEHPWTDKFEAFLKANRIEVAAFETIEDKNGQLYCYDINTNTNYNRTAELVGDVEVDAYGTLAEFLGTLLDKP